MGPYKKQVLVEKLSLEASKLNPKDPFAGIIELLLSINNKDSKFSSLAKECETWVDEQIKKVLDAYDSIPSPDYERPTEEDICKMILDGVKERRERQKVNNMI